MKAFVLLALLAGLLIGLRGALRRRGVLRVVTLGLHIASALLLFVALFPPMHAVSDATLTVLTPGATPAQLASIAAPPARRVALPDVLVDAAIERVPDLAGALRRYPQTRQLRVIGAGLPTRDRDAARAMALQFDAAPLPRGVVERSAPDSVVAGTPWPVRGRVHDVPGGSVELRDPSGAVAGSAPLDEHGAFALSTIAKGNNAQLFRLRVLDAAGAQIEDEPLPLQVRVGAAVRVAILAGGVDAEFKYLRRWILDAGMPLSARMALGGGIHLGDGSVSLGAEALAATDLLIVDDRAWLALSGADKKALGLAVRDGMGLLLRASGALPRAVAIDWRALGIELQTADIATTTTLMPERTQSGTIALLRLPLRSASADVLPMHRDDAAEPVAVWRAIGRGRVGATWLLDSYRLALAGERSRYAQWWADSVATLARARGAAPLATPRSSWVGERSVLCGLDVNAQLTAPDGVGIALLPDASHCAAYWPAVAGWHRLRSGDREAAFYVMDATEAPGLQAAERADATRAAVRTGTTTVEARGPLPRWPFFLAWLVLTGTLWWLERQRPAS